MKISLKLSMVGKFQLEQVCRQKRVDSLKFRSQMSDWKSQKMLCGPFFFTQAVSTTVTILLTISKLSNTHTQNALFVIRTWSRMYTREIQTPLRLCAWIPPIFTHRQLSHEIYLNYSLSSRRCSCALWQVINYIIIISWYMLCFFSPLCSMSTGQCPDMTYRRPPTDGPERKLDWDWSGDFERVSWWSVQCVHFQVASFHVTLSTGNVTSRAILCADMSNCTSHRGHSGWIHHRRAILFVLVVEIGSFFGDLSLAARFLLLTSRSRFLGNFLFK